MPSPITVFTLPDNFVRGHIRSWNVAVQKELRWGFAGEAAYVGTRQIDQLGFQELNWSPIGGGQAGRQLNQKFGRTGQTRLIAPIGDSQYDALQARLDRRFSNGIQFGVNYTLSKSTGIAGNPNSDGALRINIPEYYDLNKSLSDFDRTHNLNITNVTELPLGPERRWLNDGGRALADRRRLAGEQHRQLLQRHAVQRDGLRHVAERARERSARGPGRFPTWRSSAASDATMRTSIRSPSSR